MISGLEFRFRAVILRHANRLKAELQTISTRRSFIRHANRLKADSKQYLCGFIAAHRGFIAAHRGFIAAHPGE